jgi:hypothetical protein
MELKECQLLNYPILREGNVIARVIEVEERGREAIKKISRGMQKKEPERQKKYLDNSRKS